MQSYRRFSTAATALAGEWLGEVVSGQSWQLGESVGGSSEGARWISRRDGIQGVAKPAFYKGECPSAAHERIAWVLADRLDLPVPPFQLWSCPRSGEHFGISAFPFPKPITWGGAGRMGVMTSYRLAAVADQLAAGYVFHAWIHEVDHNDHPRNLLIDSDLANGVPSLAFIDHAFSLTARWTEASSTCAPIETYYISRAQMPSRVIEEVVARIQGVTDTQIDEVIAAVPRAYLPEARARLAGLCLKRRRDELMAAFEIERERSL